MVVLGLNCFFPKLSSSVRSNLGVSPGTNLAGWWALPPLLPPSSPSSPPTLMLFLCGDQHFQSSTWDPRKQVTSACSNIFQLVLLLNTALLSNYPTFSWTRCCPNVSLSLLLSSYSDCLCCCHQVVCDVVLILTVLLSSVWLCCCLQVVCIVLLRLSALLSFDVCNAVFILTVLLPSDCLCCCLLIGCVLVFCVNVLLSSVWLCCCLLIDCVVVFWLSVLLSSV